MDLASAPARALSPRRFGLALTVASLGAIAWSTLRPSAGVVGLAGAWSAFDATLNLLLFLPLGAGLTLAGVPISAVVLAGGVVSGAIELAQRWWIPGRYASAADVAANVLGVVLGVLLVRSWGRRARWWPILARPLAVVVVLGWFLGGYVAQPAIPSPFPWHAVMAPPLDGGGFLGRVESVRLQGDALAPGPVPGVPKLRARLMASRKTLLSATIISGPLPARPATILEVVVGTGTNPFLLLVQDGTTLRAYQRTGLSWVGLPGPWIVLRRGLPAAPGDTIHVRLEGTRRHLRLVAASGAGERAAEVRLAPELYWSAVAARATGGAVWWWVLPAAVSFLVLGLSLARRPRLLLVVGVVTLLASAIGGGSALPSPLVLAACGVAAYWGRRAASALSLFPDAPGAPPAA